MANPFSILRLLLHVQRPSRISVMRVAADAFWLRPGYAAMTFFGWIVVPAKGKIGLDAALVRHEMIHLRQAEACHDSWLLFYLLYIWYYLRALPQNRRMKNAAYYLNPFEMEAYRHMDEDAYLELCDTSGATEWRSFASMSPGQRLQLLSQASQQ